MKEKRISISTKDIQRLVRGETPRERLLHRLHSVILVVSGHSASAVARVYGDSPRAVAYWVSRFKEDGVSGLNEEPRSGRPSKMDDRQIKKLQIFLQRAKHKSEPINAAALAAFILAEFDISLTRRQCWRLLAQLKS